MGNLYIITLNLDNVVNIWNIRTGEKLFTIFEHENEIPQIGLCGGLESRYLVINYGSKYMTSWSLVDFKKIKTFDLKSTDEQKSEENSEESSIFKKKNVLGSKVILSKTCYEDKIGYAFRGTSIAYLFDAKSGTVSNKYQTKFESGLLSALELTNEYYVLLCKLTRTKGSDIYKIELHDIKRGQLSRIIDGCFNDNLIDVNVNLTGSHLIGVCYSDITQTSELVFWNLESEEHNHLCIRETALSPNRIIATDLRNVLTSSIGHFDLQSEEMESKQVKIWNFAARFGKPGGKYLQYDEDGIESITILNDENSSYALTRHFMNKRVAIWDLNTIGNNYQEPKTPKLVYQEGEICVDKKITFKPTDIILTFDDSHTLYILTDKGTSESEGGESSPIFESINVYNLKEERFEYKVQKSFICAYDTNEYLIVKNKTSKSPENDIVLIGLSETRNHFIINSIKTGHVMKRMKTSFREEKQRKRANDMIQSNQATKINANDVNDEMENDKEIMNIEQFIVSADHTTIVASYHAHHLCVFDINTFTHTQTMEDTSCLLLTYVSHLTTDGKYFIHHTYDYKTKVSYITIWNCKSGKIKRRLKNEFDVVSVTMSDDANHVVYCKQNGEIKYWNPFKHNSLKNFNYDRTDKKLSFEVGTKLHLIKNETQVLILSGQTYSVWDIQNSCLINIFTNDFGVPCYALILNETTLLLGQKTSNLPISLRLPN